MKVVVVDDESLIRMDLCDLLTSAGCTVVGEGKNGVEALRLAKDHNPDVILMDVKMPELDGIEAARQIRHKQLAPVVLLTAYSQDDLVAKAQDSGVYGYLIKPVREVELIPTLRMAVGRFHDERKHLDELEALSLRLEGRKYVQRATGIIMDLYHESEEKAFARIRSFSMKHQKTLEAVAKEIIEAHDKQKH